MNSTEDAGEELGRPPVVVLLHGFPDLPHVWRLQLPALAAAGFRVIAPELPGYDGEPGPGGEERYTVGALAAEVGALIEEAAPGGVVLVGHDWGGVLAWRLAATRPDLVRRLVILNAPHPRVYRRILFTTTQLLRSWYAIFFQLPWLPERLLGASDLALLERVWRRRMRGRAALPDDEIARYKRAFRRPGALSNALAYYRANGRGLVRRRVLRRRAGQRERSMARERSAVPTLVIWGVGDPYLDVRNLDGLGAHVSDLRIERIPDAGHWVQLDAPEQVNELLVAFARGG